MNNPHYLKPAKAAAKKKKGREETVPTLDVSSIPVSRLELGVDLVIGQSLSHDMHVILQVFWLPCRRPKALSSDHYQERQEGKEGEEREEGA